MKRKNNEDTLAFEVLKGLKRRLIFSYILNIGLASALIILFLIK